MATTDADRLAQLYMHDHPIYEFALTLAGKGKVIRRGVELTQDGITAAMHSPGMRPPWFDEICRESGLSKGWAGKELDRCVRRQHDGLTDIGVDLLAGAYFATLHKCTRLSSADDKMLEKFVGLGYATPAGQRQLEPFGTSGITTWRTPFQLTSAGCDRVVTRLVHEAKCGLGETP